MQPVVIVRWSVGPRRPAHPGRVVGDRIVLGGGGESLRGMPRPP